MKLLEIEKDKKEIHELYKTLIKNYNKLTEELGLKDPIEILSMYNYAIRNGYLSNNKQFAGDGRFPCRYNRFLLGEEVLTGKAGSLHVSSMLTDILNDYNIEAGTLVGVKKWHSLISNIQSDQKYEEDISIEREMGLLRYLEETIPNPTDAITHAFMDDKSYYLDPFTNKTYRKKDGVLINARDILDPKYTKSASYNAYENYSKMMRRIDENHLLTSVSEDYQKREETLNLCESNKDIFENFYQDNEDLIKETSNKILTLKKKKGR